MSYGYTKSLLLCGGALFFFGNSIFAEAPKDDTADKAFNAQFVEPFQAPTSGVNGSDFKDLSDPATIATLKKSQSLTIAPNKILAATVSHGKDNGVYKCSVSLNDSFNAQIHLRAHEIIRTSTDEVGKISQASELVYYRNDPANALYPGHGSVTLKFDPITGLKSGSGEFTNNVVMNSFNGEGTVKVNHKIIAMNWKVIGNDELNISWKTDYTERMEVRNFKVYNGVIDFELHNWIPADHVKAREAFFAVQSAKKDVADAVWEHQTAKLLVANSEKSLTNQAGLKDDHGKILDNQGIIINGVKANGATASRIESLMGNNIPEGEKLFQPKIVDGPLCRPAGK
jgi:hypothetical protein